MIDAYPRYAELLAQRGDAATRPSAARGRRVLDATTSATCRSGTSWPGSIRSTSTRDARVRALVAKGRGFTEDDKATLRAVELELLQRGRSRSTATRRRAARSSSRRRRSITRFCRCCATPTSTCARIPTSRMPRAAVPASRGRGRAARARGRAATSACSAAGRSGSGRRRGRCRTRWCRSSRGAGFTWMATDELILARTLGVDVHARRRRARRAAGAALPSVPCRRGRRDGRLRVPRPRAVGSDRLHLRRLGAGRRGRRLRRAGSSRPGGGTPARTGGGEAAHLRHPRRRERLGALRGRRPPVPPGALPAARQRIRSCGP